MFKLNYRMTFLGCRSHHHLAFGQLAEEAGMDAGQTVRAAPLLLLLLLLLVMLVQAGGVVAVLTAAATQHVAQLRRAGLLAADAAALVAELAE